MNRRLPLTSIAAYYPLALAEGEGMGTAYEYFAKRLVLGPWLTALPRPRRLLIAGLPQRYGLSFDFLHLAAALGAAVTVADDRPQRLARLQEALDALPTPPPLTLVEVGSLARLQEAGDGFDLALCSEVLQRIDPAERGDYVRRLYGVAHAFALFVPNGDNPAHTSHSGLDGVSRAELNALLAALPYSPAAPPPCSGYVDMPPFPPGITRSEEQRERAASGLPEAAAMAVMQLYARLETAVPLAVRRQRAHIVYALAVRPPGTD